VGNDTKIHAVENVRNSRTIHDNKKLSPLITPVNRFDKKQQILQKQKSVRLLAIMLSTRSCNLVPHRFFSMSRFCEGFASEPD
jgi:hypothetical protein